MELFALLGMLGSVAAGWYLLRARDLVRKGRLRRATVPEGRVACPECAEAILPDARRCPYCRQVVLPSPAEAGRDLAPPA